MTFRTVDVMPFAVIRTTFPRFSYDRSLTLHGCAAAGAGCMTTFFNDSMETA
jgi:hypothetical protein